MQNHVNPIPEGYHSITPYIIVKDAARAIEFYKEAFGAKELFRMDSPEGNISHCELQIGDSRIMLADEFPDRGALAPEASGPRGVALLIYVDDVDGIFERAVNAGAKVLRPLKNEFYGDRMGTIQDPFGHNWHLGMTVENVSPEEMKRRSDKMWDESARQ